MSDIDRDDIVFDRPVSRPVEGIPIGNGRMGTLVWTLPSSLEFQVNRVDVFAVNRTTECAHFPGPTDYCGGCGRISIDPGGKPFAAGNRFNQELSLQTAICAVSGEGVTAECWVSACHDVLVAQITDERNVPEPVEITLSMWRSPEVTNGSHRAEYTFLQNSDSVALRQTFREANHYCSSVVAVQCASGDICSVEKDARSRTVRLPAKRGIRTVVVSSAASMDEDVEVCADARRAMAAFSDPDGIKAEWERHLCWWREFWERTALDIRSSDGSGERVALDRRLFLYHMASSSRGLLPPKWNASIFACDGDARAWGSQFWLWTTEMLYWPLYAADATDLTEPFFTMYHNVLPALQEAARQRFDAEGIFLPEVIPFDGPASLPDSLVEAYRDRLLRNPRSADVSEQLEDACCFDWHLDASTMRDSSTPDGYSWISHLTSSVAELAVHAWWRYRYTGDRDWLRTDAYPLLHGVAEFYRSIVRKGDDGLLHIHHTNAHEDFWGVTDSIMDLAAIRGVLPLALRAGRELGLDSELCVLWEQLLNELAPYPMGDDDRTKALSCGALGAGTWAAGYLDAVEGSHNPEDVQLTPIFPFEDWTIETREPTVDCIARRTLSLATRHRCVLDGEALNTAIRSPIAAIRTGAGENLPDILARYRAAFSPLANGFSLFEGETAQSIEHLGLLTMVLQEALLQSVSARPGGPEVINLFPAWPKAWDVSFRLLARGGFLVSSAMQGGAVKHVDIHSRLGEECRVRNPWTRPCRIEDLDGRCCKEAGDAQSVVCFETTPGGCYRFFAV